MAEFTGNSTSQKSEESNLIVALRIRPMNDDEIMQGATPIAHRVDDNLVVLMDPMDDDDVLRQNRSREKQFMFDLALDGQSTQEEVYNKTCKFLIPGVINGFNATVFAYGATGAGKTYTMLGKDDHPGIMARALTELFSEMKRSEDDLVYKVTMSYLEIYNELIRDLLNPGSGFLDLREDQKGVQVAGLSEHSASNTEEVMEILKGGNKERTQEPTAANKTSSRSHAVLIVSVKQRHRLAGIHQQVRVGKLFLIDLAGSERAANTQNRGKRMVEGAHINRSLLALGNCINALSDKNGSKYINYRDSKLTRLLKDALGGNCKTVMIAHISPASFYFEESRNTLTYADRAKNIRTKVRQNVLDMTLHIAQYSSIITELRDEIRRLRQKVDQQQQHISSQKHMTSQSELREDNEFARLRNDLLNVFRTQMDLRQSLMELTNTDAEIGAETTRLEILIRRLEHEQQLSTSQQQRLDEQENDQTNSDANLQEHVDINRAKDDLESLVVEQKKSEKMKVNLDKELANAIIKTKKIEEELRQLCSTKSLSSDQQEIVTLLSKLHAIQIENTQLKSNLIQCKFDSRRRDLHLDWQRHHMGVARLLVHQQRALIDENDLTQPPELGDLYDVYEKQATEINNRSFLPAIHSHKVKSSSSDSIVGVDSSSGYPLPRLFVHSSNGYKDSHPVSTDNRISDETNKLFVPRNPAGGELRDGQAFLTQEVSPRSVTETPIQVSPSGVYQPRNREVNGGGDTNRYDEIEDLILNGESRKNMVHGTRGIAQLAAHRRANKQIRNGGAQDQLTQSRLALHDRKYTPMTLVPARNDDVMSFSTNTTTDALTSYQAKNRSRRRQAGTRLATKPQMMLQRDYDAGKYRSKQSQMTHDNAARGSMSRVPVLRGGRNSRPHRTHFSVPHHDVNFNDASQPTNDAMLSPVDEFQTHKSIRGNNTTRKPYQTATTVNNENDFMAVTGLGLQ